MKPEMQPVNNIVKNIVYSGSKADIRMTMVAGNILYENGSFNIGERPERVYSEVNKVIEGMRD